MIASVSHRVGAGMKTLFFSLLLGGLALFQTWDTSFALQNENTTPSQTQSATVPNTSNAKPHAASSTQAMIHIEVMVTDDQGRLLTGLKPENFRIFDNKQPQQVSYFAPPKSPMTIVLLMEYSSSSYQYYAAKSAYWSERFVDQLEPNDWVALVTYDLQPRVQVDFTHNSYAVRDAIAGLGFPAFREANLFDSLIEVLERLDTIHGKKAILVIGTGLNSFSAATFDDVRRELRKSDAIVFCVGTAEQEFVRYTGFSSGYAMAINQLETFAKQTGGLAYFPRFEGELPDIFSSVAALLRNAYTIGFTLPASNHDGRYHRLKVEIVDKDGNPLRVRDKQGKWHKVEVMTREGFTAPRSKSESVRNDSGQR